MEGRTFRVIGRGRAGGSIARALVSVGWEERPALGRGDDVAAAGHDVDLVVIATPDAAIEPVATAVDRQPDTVVVHLSGSKGLAVLGDHHRVGALHPLMTLPNAERGSQLLRGGDESEGGVWFAVAGDPLVTEIVEQLGGRAVVVDDADRERYHATAAVASNHLVALLGQVERLARQIGVPPEAYLALAEASLANVRDLGAAAALTGPAARGDTATIEAHVAALARGERELYLVLARAAAALAGRQLDIDDA